MSYYERASKTLQELGFSVESQGPEHFQVWVDPEGERAPVAVRNRGWRLELQTGDLKPLVLEHGSLDRSAPLDAGRFLVALGYELGDEELEHRTVFVRDQWEQQRPTLRATLRRFGKGSAPDLTLEGPWDELEVKAVHAAWEPVVEAEAFAMWPNTEDADADR